MTKCTQKKEPKASKQKVLRLFSQKEVLILFGYIFKKGKIATLYTHSALIQEEDNDVLPQKKWEGRGGGGFLGALQRRACFLLLL